MTHHLAVQSLVTIDLEFAARAQASSRNAFLDYLAADSLILRPGMQPGRSFYSGSADDDPGLERYPTLADTAQSGDLGFTCGPWSNTPSAGAAPTQGHYVSIWRRDGPAPWRIEFDGEVAHPAAVQSHLRTEDWPMSPSGLPPPTIAGGAPVLEAVRDFQDTARQDTLSGALRTYARDFDFRFFSNGVVPCDVGPASESSATRAIKGDWRERALGRSVDSTMLYSVGEVIDTKSRPRYVYGQIWQYDPKVANWGLRILLINQLPPDG